MQVGMVWNVGRSGMECRQEWYGMQVGMVWNVGRSGMECRQEWHGMQVGVVWNVGRNGIECRQEWYGMQVRVAWSVGNLNHHGHLALACPSCRVGYVLVLEPRGSPVRVHLLLAHLWTVYASMEPAFFLDFFQFTNEFPKPEVLYTIHGPCGRRQT